MPEKRTVQRAQKAKREGKAPTTQAGEFVREEIEHVREGKHGARSSKFPPPKKGRSSERTRKQAQRDYTRGQRARDKKPSPKRSRAAARALRREGRQAASKRSRQAKKVRRSSR
jgi:hypothetical protein